MEFQSDRDEQISLTASMPPMGSSRRRSEQKYEILNKRPPIRKTNSYKRNSNNSTRNNTTAEFAQKMNMISPIRSEGNRF